jgi:hypothetical protein
MSDKLEQLKKRQEELENQIKIEELKYQKKIIDDELNLLSPSSDEENKNINTSDRRIRQQTYKGRVINLSGNHYKIPGIIQAFGTTEQAKRYIDSMNQEAYKIDTHTNRKKKSLSVYTLTGLFLMAVFAFISFSFDRTKANDPTPTRVELLKFSIPDGSSYVCLNKNATEMIISLVYSRTSPDLASIISHAPTLRVDGVITWTHQNSNNNGNEEKHIYKNNNIKTTALTIYPRSSQVVISGADGRLDFYRCAMVKNN